MDNSKSPLKVALHGMDERSSKMMAMYLQGPCKGIAVVVDEPRAEIDIFDADTLNTDKLILEHLAKKLHKPIIVISLHDRKFNDVLYVKKPVKLDDMLAILAEARALAYIKSEQAARQSLPSLGKTPAIGDRGGNSDQAEGGKPVLKRFVIDADEQKKTSKHQAATQLNEKAFSAFIGNVSGIDVNDPKQAALAVYNPKEYFQGYVESAYKVSQEKGQARQLNSGWSPLIIFPLNHEVWLDVDDSQLRAFSGLAITNTLGTKMSITPLNPEVSSVSRTLERFHSMDAFLWKIACWASKGRYPDNIDIHQPVYLKNWPNFTRLLVTPHALRITALLIQGPRTLINVSDVLNIKPQYVFVFISAAYSLGLVGQVRREADRLVAATEIKPNKNQGLLSRILSTLRGKKA